MNLIKSLKVNACKFASIASAAFLTASVFAYNAMAEEATTSGLDLVSLVDATAVKTDIFNAVKPWVMGGLSVAVTIFLVRLGWRLIKSFTNRG